MSIVASKPGVTAVKKKEEWRVYKPKKTNDGSASKLELKIVTTQKEKDGKSFSIRDVQLFWVSAKQTGVDANGNASFGWGDDTKNVTLKLGEVDIGEILAVLTGQKDQSGAKGEKFNGLFHKNASGSTSFLLQRGDSGYSLRVSKKVGAKPPVAVTHQITFGEGQVLRVILEAAVRQSYQW